MNKALLSGLTALSLLTAAGQAQVVISQVFGGGGNTGAIWRNDFIEIFNRGSTPVNISGWSVQYLSATSNSTSLPWTATALPNITLNPGQYCLVQEAAGANGAAPLLPTPDATGTIAMSSNNAKIALVNTTTLLPPTATVPGGWSTLPQVVDFVGYGTANDFEGAGAAPGLVNTTAAVRNNAGCIDTNVNAADFTALAPSPRNTASPVNSCSVASPDLSLAMLDSGCNPTVGAPGAYQISATATNSGTGAAAGSTINVVLPTSVTYVNSSSSQGTTSYNAGTRTVTANLGTVNGSGGSATLTVNSTVNAAGGFTVTGSTATTTSEPTTGNNSATKNNVTVDPANPFSVVMVGSASAPSIATSVFEDIGGFPFERKITTIGRPFRSPNGRKFIVRCDTDITPTTDNTCLIVGEIALNGTVTYTMVARENFTAPIAGQPTWKILSGSFNALSSINDAGQYVFTCQLTDGGVTPVLTYVLCKGTVGVPGFTVIAQGDAVPAAVGSGGATWSRLQSASIQANGTVSFLGTMTGGTVVTADNTAFVSNNGNTLLARKGSFTPTGQSGTPAAMDVLDDDGGSSNGRGVRLSEDGTTWIATGEVNNTTTTSDNVVVINGGVAVQEGSPLLGSAFTDAASWSTAFGTNNIPWTHMESNGDFFVHGYNGATAGFNQGQDWVVRNSQVIATTGAPIHTGATETWADNILQRTFFMACGNGADYVVGGLTNRSTGVPDQYTDGVLVLNGSAVVLRENQPVDIGGGDIRYVNFINDNQGFIGAGRKMYVSVNLRDNNDICDSTFSGLPNALLVINLPMTQPACPADLGQQGGVPGQDNQLNNDDFIVFINYFFAQNPLADVGVQGGQTGHDNQWNNDDFVAYINLFFQGCNP